MADARRQREHGREGGAPERGSRQTLERIVRACGAARRSESEFVRALRAHQVAVRPRYGEGGRSSVVGYSVSLPGPDTGADRVVWFGGGRLARDLTLPALRAGWQQDAVEQAAALRERSSSSSALRSASDRVAVADRGVMWHRCVGEIDRLRAQLRGVDNDRAGVARVAHDAAGILAAWSVALEGNQPGGLARASRQLARSAEQPAHQRRVPARPRSRGSMLAAYLLAGAEPDSAAGWVLLARQMMLLGRDLARLHQLRGEVDRARELQARFETQLAHVHQQLSARPAAPVDPEAAAMIATVRRPLPALRPGAADAHQDAAAARRLSDASQRRRPRGR